MARDGVPVGALWSSARHHASYSGESEPDTLRCAGDEGDRSGAAVSQVAQIKPLMRTYGGAARRMRPWLPCAARQPEPDILHLHRSGRSISSSKGAQDAETRDPTPRRHSGAARRPFRRGGRRAEIKVLCSGAMRPVLQQLAPAFENASGHKLVIEFATAGKVEEKVRQTRVGSLVSAERDVVDMGVAGS
jgi:hypothetical protein